MSKSKTAPAKADLKAAAKIETVVKPEPTPMQMAIDACAARRAALAEAMTMLTKAREMAMDCYNAVQAAERDKAALTFSEMEAAAFNLLA
ncbi:MAG: hypothetical protein GC182_08675 [Rhodopseudomonas sp.]|nr:hypothetical protein [Rhodopseudomonas sp.]